MSYGQGNIQVTILQKGGGGGGVETLDNGLTLTGINGQLGGTLVKDTEIDLEGFNVSFVGEGTEQIDFNNVGLLTAELTEALIFEVVAGSNVSALALEPGQFGISGADGVTTSQVQSLANVLSLSTIKNTVEGASITMPSSGIEFKANDLVNPLNSESHYNPNIWSNQFTNGSATNGLFNYSGNSWVWSVDDTAAKLSQIEIDLTGIYSTVSNAGLTSTIFQTTSEIQFTSPGSIQGNIPVGSPSSYIEFSSGVPTGAGYILGMRLTNDKFDIQDLNNVGSKRYLDIDRVNKNFIFGDVDNFGNGTKVSIVDGLQKIYLLANDGINTTAPSANGQGSWQLGKVLAGAVALDATSYIEVNIDGVVKKMLVAS